TRSSSAKGLGLKTFVNRTVIVQQSHPQGRSSIVSFARAYRHVLIGDRIVGHSLDIMVGSEATGIERWIDRSITVLSGDITYCLTVKARNLAIHQYFSLMRTFFVK